MVERILGFAALVARALQIKVEKAAEAEQIQKLRNWREIAPAEPASDLSSVNKAYRVTVGGR
jgi:hypothetical protein